MLHPDDHAALLARHDFVVPPGDAFTPAERELLGKYGRWLEGLAAGAIRPTTPSQEQFVLAARGEAEPTTDFERAWAKVVRERANGAQVQAQFQALQSARAKAALLDAEYRDARAAVLATVRDQLDAIDAAFAEQIQAAGAEAAAAEQAVRELVLALGRSVNVAGVKATFRSPPTTWDSEKLTAYAEAHPELLAFRRVGRPSVALRFADGGPSAKSTVSEAGEVKPDGERGA